MHVVARPTMMVKYIRYGSLLALICHHDPFFFFRLTTRISLSPLFLSLSARTLIMCVFHWPSHSSFPYTVLILTSFLLFLHSTPTYPERLDPLFIFKFNIYATYRMYIILDTLVTSCVILWQIGTHKEPPGGWSLHLVWNHLLSNTQGSNACAKPEVQFIHTSQDPPKR